MNGNRQSVREFSRDARACLSSENNNPCFEEQQRLLKNAQFIESMRGSSPASATGAYGDQSFAYDADGNRLSQSVAQNTDGRTRARTYAYAYASSSNMLQSVSGREGLQYTYTANGDLASESGDDTDRSFTYDARNRLSSLINQGMSAHTIGYKTNALGERVQKSGASDGLNDFDDATDYIYDEQGRLIAEGHDGRISREYIYLGSLPVAELTHGQVYYIHDNHLGAPQKMTNAQQRIVWDRISEPFGKTYALKGDQDLMNLSFPGQYHDAESDLDYNMFRSYDPSTGRYTQSDPIGQSWPKEFGQRDKWILCLKAGRMPHDRRKKYDKTGTTEALTGIQGKGGVGGDQGGADAGGTGAAV